VALLRVLERASAEICDIPGRMASPKLDRRKADNSTQDHAAAPRRRHIPEVVSIDSFCARRGSLADGQRRLTDPVSDPAWKRDGSAILRIPDLSSHANAVRAHSNWRPAAFVDPTPACKRNRSSSTPPAGAPAMSRVWHCSPA
jgi:hypothetical protein